MAIKPSGVPYEQLTRARSWSSTSERAVGRRLATALVGYADPPRPLPGFGDVGGVVHTHSPFATAWAQAGRPLPCLGTTHADHFRGAVPVTRALNAHEIDGDYEAQTGSVIVRRQSPSPEPSTCQPSWSRLTGRSRGEPSGAAVENAIALEAVAALALRTQVIEPQPEAIDERLRERHFARKHGREPYYGQREGASPPQRRRAAARGPSRTRCPHRVRSCCGSCSRPLRL